MKLIDKDKIDEILRNLWKEDDGHNSEHRICYNKALQEVQCEIDTLEVKEMDLIIHTIISECCDWFSSHTNLSHNEIEDCRNLMLTLKDEQLKVRKGMENNYR